MKRILAVSIALGIVAGGVPVRVAVSEDAPTTVDRDLRAAGLEPNRESVVDYLESIRPTKERAMRIRKAIERLDDPDYAAREEATRELIRTPRLSRNRIEALAKSGRPEVRLRARHILTRADFSSHRARILATLGYVERENFEGVASLLLDVSSEWHDDPFVSDRFVRTIASIAASDDVPRLRTFLDAGATPQRLAAVMGLARLLGESFRPELRRLTKDDEAAVQLTAARALLDAGDRDALRTIVAALEADELDVRLRASRVLRGATGRQFGFAAYETPERRAVGAKAWQDWLEDHLATAELRLPVELETRIELGRILVGLHTEKKLREIDAEGNTVWEAGGFTYLWGCHALPNGHRLAVDYENKYVVEFDAHGNRIWLADNLPGNPTNVERLPNGNTLLAIAEPGIVLELSLAKEIVWQRPMEGRPTTAQRLPNGHTLVCLQFARRVVEIDTAGRVVWEVPGLRRPHTAQRLENGNTLVCEMDPEGRIAEFDAEGELIWEKTGFSNLAQAQRLANGNTIVSTGNGLHVVGPRGEELQHIKVSRSRFFAF